MLQDPCPRHCSPPPVPTEPFERDHLLLLLLLNCLFSLFYTYSIKFHIKAQSFCTSTKVLCVCVCGGGGGGGGGLINTIKTFWNEPLRPRLPFSKKSASTRSVFKSFLPVNTYPDIFENGGSFLFFSIIFACPRHLTSLFSKTSVFLCPHGSINYPVKKIYSLETVFKKLRFRLSKTPFTCERKPYPEKKRLRFQNYPDTCGRGLILFNNNLLKHNMVR